MTANGALTGDVVDRLLTDGDPWRGFLAGAHQMDTQIASTPQMQNNPPDNAMNCY